MILANLELGDAVLHGHLARGLGIGIRQEDVALLSKRGSRLLCGFGLLLRQVSRSSVEYSLRQGP